MKNKKKPQTLIELLISQKNSKDKGITFIPNGNSEDFFSYHQLYTTALSLLGYLQHNGLKPGDELVFQVDDNKTFISFFWASILGGIIPVPVSIAHHTDIVQKLWKIKNTLNNPCLLISRTNYDKLLSHESMDERNNRKAFTKVLFIDDAAGAGRKGKIASVTPDQTAFLQFSSGSTGNPKGVVLSHKNIVTNTISAWLSNEFNGWDKFLSWMPLTHDMGLIGFHLYPITLGASHYIMPTDLFIRNPLLWLKKVSEHRVSIICSPNFGYKYYLNQFTEDTSKGLDLSSVRIIFNGAEPISASLTRRFMETLSGVQLSPLAMRAVYGLAEATLQVTYPLPNTPFQSIFIPREKLMIGSSVSEESSSADIDTSVEVANVGKPTIGMAIKITDDKGHELHEGHVGIIWIKGDSVTSQYYNNESATKAVIRSDGWLNTGDTGFFLKGYLYVVGRVKDIIFINGINIYPHDIERTVESLNEIETGKVVACGIPNPETGSESIVVFVLSKSSIEKFVPLANTIKKFIASKLGLEIQYVIPVRKIFKTTSGKIRRHLFSEEYHKGTYAEVVAQMKLLVEKEEVMFSTALENNIVDNPGGEKIQRWLIQWLQRKLDLKVGEITIGGTFAGYGMTSIQAIAMVSDLERYLGATIDSTIVYNFSTVGTLSKYLSENVKLLTESNNERDLNKKNEAVDDDRIAVIGMGCRFPRKSSTPEAFWSFLNSDQSAITVVPQERWNVDAYYDKDEDAPGKMYTNQGGFIDEVDQFDPSFFGISPKEAACMDPQQRLLLEVCWEALEYAGLCPSKLRGSDSGIFIGMGTDDYEQIIHTVTDNTYFTDAFSGLGIERSIAAGRIAYLLDFHGPVVQLDTACSSSLLSIHQACQNLLLKECSLALAGGVNLMLSPETTVKLCRMKALSPSGLCKTFDDKADGYVRGEGAGIVVLKRLRDALNDGDTILGVIKGSAVNHDGLSNGLTAPNGIAQQQLIEKTLANANLTSDAVQYVEVHGTGTRLGDPIELQALNAIYGRLRSANQPLIVGAVKTKIGHLEAAAGIAGFIKAILCLKYQKIPANLHFHEPNHFIPWSEMGLRVVDKTIPWDVTPGEKRRAAVSAFGLSGTNVHIIIEEAELNKVEASSSQSGYPSYPILLSAKTPLALQTAAKNYAELLDTSSGSLADIAYGTAITRDAYQFRLAVEGTSKENAQEILQAYIDGIPKTGVVQGNVRAQKESIAWLFTGQGSQYWNMGRELYENNTVFKNVIDHCDHFLKGQWEISLVELLYEKAKEECNIVLKETSYTQPALFAIECALAEVWKSWGIYPSIVAGHSVGEYAAAYVAGVFSLDDGLRLIKERARLMQSVREPGAMSVVFASEALVSEKIKPYGKDLSIAAINGPALTVISGKKIAVSEVVGALKKVNVDSKELQVSHAFHSSLMEPILLEFEKIAKDVEYHAPVISLVSNVTGELVTSEIAKASYWCNQIVEPVYFSKSVDTINANGVTVLMEIGPQPSLLTMAQLTFPYDESCLLPSMRQGQSAWSTMLRSLMTLYVKGIQVNWDKFYNHSNHTKVSLPTYPFQRNRYWIEHGEQRPFHTPITNEPILAMNDKTPSHANYARTICMDLSTVFADLLKAHANEINIHTPFVELGADSMVLASAVRRIEKKYNLNFSIRQLFEELNTLERMADYIATNIPIDIPSTVSSEEQVAKPLLAATRNETPGTWADVFADNKIAVAIQATSSQDSVVMIQRQMEIMEQLIKLQSQQLGIAPLVRDNGHHVLPATKNGSHNGTAVKPQFADKPQQILPVHQNGKKTYDNQGIFPKVETQHEKMGFSVQQQEYLNTFINRYNEKTKTSKKLTQQYRGVLTDNRLSVGFRFSTKELHYPIQISSSCGSKITDVDGNEYIDLTMGFGVSLLGHRPEVVTKAVQTQLNTGFQLGPQSPLTGEVATMVSVLTGMERVSFHNSGTEAVMTAIRLARAVTGRKKIAIFKGAYHGHFDGTLAVIEDVETSHQGVPLTLGIPANMVADVLMFDYTNPTVVQQIQSYAHELAAVLVEPVQSRNPGYQPKALLKALRGMTSAENVLLIFDEMITGFRIHPGGAQAYFGIEADLATYGKVAGGGLPIGIIAGKRRYMDVLDGGNWQYGDQSYPQVDTTYFAGTFCKHPLSMAASLALLKELQQQGPTLQEKLNARTTALVKDIAAFFQQNDVPIEVHNFGSLFHFSTSKNMDLFFYHLLEKGVYIWEGRTSFLSTAHTDDDINFILAAVKQSVKELQQAGFLPIPPNSPAPGPKEKKQLNGLTSIGIETKPERIPLSFSQKRLWIIDQMEGSAPYHEPAVYNVKGLLNKVALEHALQTIVNRHEALRTVIEEHEGKPYQRTLPKDQWKLKSEEAPFYTDDRLALKEYISTLIRAPFSLSKDYMLRAHLIRLSGDEHILVLTMHHIAFDAWSEDIILSELVALYEAYDTNRTVELAPLNVQYADYALWQRAYLTDDVLNEKLAYWKNKLEGVEPLNLPTDLIRPVVQHKRSKTAVASIDKTCITQLQQLSQQQGVTLFMTLLTVFKVLLYRYSGQKDICVGSPIAGRMQEEVENLVGFFVNTLALRSDLSDNPLFTTLLQQVRETILEAHDHQEVPFEKVVDAVVKDRSLDQSPIFQILFVLQNTPDVPAFNLGAVKMIPEANEDRTAKFDLAFSIVQGLNESFVSVEYNTDVYTTRTVENFIAHYNNLLVSLIADPSQQIGNISMLSDEEEYHLQTVLNAATADYPKEKTLVELFEAQVKKTPESIAVVYEGQGISYRDLNEKSNQVAHYLKKQGVREESFVAICIERSIEMMIGLMGILKSGGAYVPIDPSYPEERIAYMLSDTQAQVILSSKVSSGSLPENSKKKITLLDEGWAEIIKRPKHNLKTNLQCDNLAYVIYTSGSTGTPKGVMIEHGAVVNLIYDQTNNFSIDGEERILQFSNYCFDASVEQIFLALFNGAALVLISEHILADRQLFEQVLIDEKITHLHATPGFLATITADKYRYLKRVVAGGDSCDVNLTSAWAKHVDFYNEYGPTETTVTATLYRCAKGDLNKLGSVPIGGQIRNNNIYILDQNGNTMPIGVAGELCVGGIQVARGYLNQRELTEERFMSNPFDKEHKSRLYKTGDLARWLPDGNIEYIGRLDDQVKIRGYRIELGEVEHALQQYPGVQQCVVVAKQDSSGHKRLIAYLVGEEEMDKKSILTFLKRTLPEYMVPLLIDLPALPLTKNGKIDKKALPDPDATHLASKEYVAPRTATEEQLSQIWQQLLGLDRVGIHDNFFELGGHSLLATQVVSAIRKELAVELSIKDLFSHPTVCGLSNHLQNQAGVNLLPSIQVNERPTQIPLSYSQERLWFIDKLQGSIHYHVPAVLRLFGILDKDALVWSFREIVNRHEALRTVIKECDGKAYQYIKEKDGWQLEDVEFDPNSIASLPALLEELAQRPFDLSADDMLRAHLIKSSDHEHQLIVVLHHIASDGWSMSILIKEFTEIYLSRNESRAPILEELPVQYADYAVWQRNYLKETGESSLLYWKQQLSGVSPLELATDFARPAVQGTEGGTVELLIDKSTTEELKRLSQREGVTMFMSLITILKVLLYRYSGQEDICVGTPIANRTQKEIEPLIGFFVNTIALRSDLTNNPSFEVLLQQVRNMTLEAYVHQQVPFEQVVERVGIARDLSRSPLFQVMFVYQTTPDEIPALRLGDMSLQAKPIESGTTKFDLTFSTTETTDGLLLRLEYNKDLYTSATVARMAGHFKVLLKSILKNPGQPISVLQMLTEQETDHLLADFNNTRTDYPTEKTILDLFEGQVAKTPDNIAVVYEGKELSYQELDEKSNQLAHYLRIRGVREESLVAICIERSLEMIIGILGILKAGGTYVPIDPSYPDDRIAYMLADTKAQAILSNKASSDSLLRKLESEIILLDEDWSTIAEQQNGKVTTSISPTNLAYIIYTSGSTGKPKGVMIEHTSVVNLIHHRGKHFGLGDDERILQFSNYCFDASVEQIFLALLNGVTLILPPQKVLLDKQLFEQFLENEKITLLYATPGFLTTITPGKYGNLRRIALGGEASSVQLLSEWVKHVDYYNEYGPTETTVTAAAYLFPKGSSQDLGIVPIGKPTGNTRIYILDHHGNTMPVGVPGELHIGGSGLARGYINLPALTMERFIANPFDSEPGSRLYKTGDLARWLPDGNIEYIGRLDDQVKIRGYRIELGEIEHALQQCAGVHQCVVVAREDVRGHKRLIGYVVAEEGLDKKAALTFLHSQLPEYMVPLLIDIPALPLTSNGKIDKKALPDPDISHLVDSEYVGPRTPIEEQLTHIWQELLGLERVGIHDNFFELGGDSIITIQVVSRAKQAGILLQPRDIFQHQSIARLSANLNQSNTLLNAEQGILNGESSMLPIQQWFFEQHHAQQSHYNQGVLLEIEKDITKSQLSQAMSALAKQHDALRFYYGQEEGGWRQYYGDNVVEVTVKTLSAANADELSSAITSACDACQRNLDIEQGKLIQSALLMTPLWSTHNRLFLSIHHLAVDGVSWRIFLEDLENCLALLAEGKALTLGTKGSSYREWGLALQAYTLNNVTEAQQSFWKSVVQAYKPLPVDKTDGVVLVKDVSVYEVKLSVPLTEALLKDVPKAYSTEVNDILLSALVETISQWTGQNEIVVGLEGHGREDISAAIDISHTIGWFTNLYPVLLSKAPSASTAQLIKSVKEQLRQIPDKGIGYGALRYLHPNASIRENLSGIHWDVIFNYLGQLDNVMASNGCLKTASESVGASIGEHNTFSNKLEVNCSISNGQLELLLGYSASHYHTETIARLANQYLENLGALIMHCQNKKYKQYTLSDYGMADVVEIEQLVNSYDVEDIYPLSPTQEGFLFYSIMDPGAQTYFMQTSIPFIGNLDVILVKDSFNKVMQRHAILRTAFVHRESGAPLQVVTRHREVDFEFLDIRNLLDETEKSIHIRRIKEADKSRLFNLSKDVLMRIKVIQVNDQQSEFIWSAHHIVMDGWCIGIIMTEFFEIYYNLRQHKIPALRAVQPYKNYIQWLFRQNKEVSKAYWSDYLHNYTQSSGVPRNLHQRNLPSAYKHKLISLFLGDRRSSALNKFAQKSRVTFNTLMQTAWGILLSKYNGKRDVVYGAVVSGRSPEIEGIETMVGLFINSIPVRISYDHATNINDLLQQVQYDAMESENHQFYPLAEIQNQSSLKRNLVDHIMVMASYPLDKKFIDPATIDENIRIKVDVSALETFEQTNYDFNIMIHPGESIRVDFGFNENVYDLDYMECVQKHFVTVLDNILLNDQLAIDDIEFLTIEEKQQIIFEFNDTTVSYPKNKTIHALFEDQVRRNPQAIALAYNGRSMTYLQLNQKANQLAHYLRHKYDVKADRLIGLMPDRDENMIIALLAILKSGGAYLPIDPEIPENRIDYILSNGGVSLLLTCSHFLDKVKDNYQGEVLQIDEEIDLDVYSTENPDPVSFPDSLAYVIYTSGSTGQPKGVMISHRSNVNMSLDQVRKFDIRPEDNVLQFASLSFDASISELCMAFNAGATLVLIDKAVIKNQIEFLDYIKNHDVSVVTLPPSYLSVLPLDQLGFLRTIITAGETPKIKDVAFLHTRANYYNAYGPTECAVCVTINKVEHVDEQTSTLSIGGPIANYRCYILNDLMQPLPVGMAGEICVAGVGLAKGYLNNEELTGQKFVTSPYVQEPVLYRTGDLGRWLPDGQIDFIGRKDTQVKVRGYRVELGEIENTLLLHPKVQDCAVVARKQHEENEIMAYVIKKKQIELWPSLSEYFVYDEILYNTMANDQLRNEKYKNAFRKVLKDKVVLEIGPGKEAILSRLAIEEGAKKVYAVEILEESYLQAKETIRKYGLEDKVTVIHGDITNVKLPELADYCISEIVGPIGGSEGSAKLINAARSLLKNPTCMIPSRSLTSIAAITLPAGEFDATFEEVGAYYVNKVFEQVGYKFDLRLCLHNFPKKNVISSYDVLEDLDYTSISSLESDHEIFLQIQKDAIFHGFIVWLNLYCDNDEVINTLENKFIWLPVYFPVFAQGVSLKQGDYIKASVSRTLCDNKLNPDFKVEGVINTGDESIPFVYNSYHNASIYQENEFYRKLFYGNDLNVTQEIKKTEIRDFLVKYLPDYMIPSHLLFLDKFPMNNSGKIDRNALTMENALEGNNAEYVAPRNAIETMLTMIWEDVLGVKKVGVFDNFFDLGGHSLKAIQAKSMMDQMFETTVDLKYIFNYPTIESLAKAIGEGIVKKPSYMIQLNRIQENNQDVFCLPPSIGTSIVYKGLAEKLERKINFFGLQCKGIDDDEQLEETMEDLARTFVAEIINSRPADEYTLVGYSFGGSLIYEMAKQMEVLDKKVKLINIDKGLDLDIESSILMSGEEFDKAAEETLGFWYKSLQSSDLVMRSKRVNERLIKLEYDYVKEGIVKADFLALESLDNEEPNRLEEWSAYVSGTFTQVYLRGNHLQLLDTQHLPETSAAIEQWLGLNEKVNHNYSLV